MKKSPISLLICIFLFLVACRPSETSPTETPAQPTLTALPPTATLITLPTQTPTTLPGTDIEEAEQILSTNSPTPTTTPEYAQIQSGNLDKLELIETIPLQAKLLGEKDSAWKTARWTSNNAYVIVETSLGMDLLDGGNLEFLREYPGIYPLNFAGQDQIIGQTNEGLVKLNILTGETEDLNYAVLRTQEGWPVMAVSEGGDWIAFVSDTNVVELIEPQTGANIRLMIERQVAIEQIDKIQFGLNDQFLYVSCTNRLDKTLTIGFDLNTSEEAFEIISDGAIALAPDQEYFAYEDLSRQHTYGFTVRQRDGLIQSQFSTMAGGDYSNALTYSYRAVDLGYLNSSTELAVLYSGYEREQGSQKAYSSYQAIFIWDVLTGTPIQTLTNIGILPQTISIAPDSQRFLLSFPDGVLRIYNLENGELLAESQAYDLSDSRVFSPDSSKYALVSGQEIRVFDTARHELLYSIPLEESTPAEIKLSFIGEEQIGISVISANHFRPEERLWGASAYTSIIDLETRQEIRKLSGAANCRYSADGQYAACEHNGSYLGEVTSLKIFDLQNGVPVQNFVWQGEGYFVFDPLDDQLVHCVKNDNIFSITDIITGALSYYHYPCEPFAFDPTGLEILFSDGSVMWKMTDEIIRTLVLPIEINRHQEHVFFFQPDSDFVIMNNGAFSFSVGGAATVFDGVDIVYDAILSQDGMALLLLTDRGLETWQVEE